MRGLFASFGIVLLLFGCASPDSAGQDAVQAVLGAAQPGLHAQQLWVLDSGWHTGLILSRGELGAQLAGLSQVMPKARYFVFGWGNRKFYMAPDPSVSMYLDALFPSPSVVLVESCAVSPRACFTSQVKLKVLSVTPAGIARLEHYLDRSLQRNARGGFSPVGPGPDTGSEFFASPLSYDAFHTCNTWTAQALHMAGLPVSYRGVIFAGQLWQQFNHRRA